MKINFSPKNNPIKIDVRSIGNAAIVVWEKIHTLLFFAFLFCAIGLGGYIWQRNISGSSWSNEKKQEYINSQNKTVIFKENDFKKAIEDVQRRKNRNLENRQSVKDIFKAY